MIQYRHHRAVSLDDVANVLREYGGKARIVAGGADILVQIHEKDKRWKDLRCLPDIAYLNKELRYTNEDEEYVYIGPLSIHTDSEQSKVIVKHIPFLGRVSATVGSPQIRNRGTLGGSIGNRSPVSDSLPALIAADTLIRMYGQDGGRGCLLRDFYERKRSLEFGPEEFTRKSVVKKLPEGTGIGFSRLDRRKASIISRLNYAAAFTLDSEGTITEAKITPGCIFTQPDRVEKAEQVLIGQRPSEELLTKAGRAVSEVMIERTSVRWSIQYKEPAVQEIILRALCQVAEMEV